MRKRYSRMGLIGSIALHCTAFAVVWNVVNSRPTAPAVTEETTSISMEMMAALIEQPPVAIALEQPVTEQVEEQQPEPSEPEPIAMVEPPPPPKPIPKEKPKEKAKEKPKKTEQKPVVKAIEKGNKPQNGIVAQAVTAKPATQEKQGTLQGNVQANESGTGKASGGEIDAYKAQLRAMLQRRANNAYPQREKMMRKTGTVILAFSLSANGQVNNVNIQKSSGSDNLDAAAVKAAQSTAMRTPPPSGFPSTLTVPINFTLQ